MSALFGKLPNISRAVESRKPQLPAFDNSLAAYLAELDSGVLEEAVSRVLQLPAVASKTFLITIGVKSPRLPNVAYNAASCPEESENEMLT